MCSTISANQGFYIGCSNNQLREWATIHMFYYDFIRKLETKGIFLDSLDNQSTNICQNQLIYYFMSISRLWWGTWIVQGCWRVSTFWNRLDMADSFPPCHSFSFHSWSGVLICWQCEIPFPKLHCEIRLKVLHDLSRKSNGSLKTYVKLMKRSIDFLNTMQSD